MSHICSPFPSINMNIFVTLYSGLIYRRLCGCESCRKLYVGMENTFTTCSYELLNIVITSLILTFQSLEHFLWIIFTNLNAFYVRLKSTLIILQLMKIGVSHSLVLSYTIKPINNMRNSTTVHKTLNFSK